MNPSLALKAVHLRVTDVERSVEFYTRAVGFFVGTKNNGRVELATLRGAPPILILTKAADVTPAPRDAAGLFHAALLFPDRRRLAGWLKFSSGNGVQFDGFSDHAVSEAIYFSDPDGNGLEFYADRPKDAWPYAGGEIAMTTRLLDVRGLVADASPDAASPLDGCRWGHLHLSVTNLDRSETFYRDEIGLEVTQRSYPGARFMAADGYHHHLGLNTWGNARRPQSTQSPGLAEATFASTGILGEKSLTDPDGIHVKVQPMRAAT
jgi:catechol 2,3-dioxygenase